MKKFFFIVSIIAGSLSGMDQNNNNTKPEITDKSDKLCIKVDSQIKFNDEIVGQNDDTFCASGPMKLKKASIQLHEGEPNKITITKLLDILPNQAFSEGCFNLESQFRVNDEKEQKRLSDFLEKEHNLSYVHLPIKLKNLEQKQYFFNELNAFISFFHPALFIIAVKKAVESAYQKYPSKKEFNNFIIVPELDYKRPSDYLSVVKPQISAWKFFVQAAQDENAIKCLQEFIKKSRFFNENESIKQITDFLPNFYKKFPIKKDQTALVQFSFSTQKKPSTTAKVFIKNKDLQAFIELKFENFENFEPGFKELFSVKFPDIFYEKELGKFFYRGFLKELEKTDKIDLNFINTLVWSYLCMKKLFPGI